ncbi:RRXRR domain-containing protein [Scytonema hofmannii FACHB-248]|uniref:RRXRR domain-containing protein n=1 Tax=Scytonema hofmannii FACHB-248 TaxID=1842502 RepID=A0ABR8GL34_9CYAN|nr:MULTISPECIES: RRXRR domain-containing protein [Nostocales]MBD2604038.1 RRXRR domain-containing protein [Scytonema hofmannii FACHB-248]
MIRVSVLDKDGKPLMPTKPSRARRWLKEGKAKILHNDLNIFCIQLLVKPSGYNQQSIALGLDPGKKFTRVGVQSTKFTLFMAHLILPFPDVTKKMSGRLILRCARRGRRINRKVAFNKRAHRQKRFDNRKQNKLPPSIRANKELELRVTKELIKLFPVTQITYEYIKAKGDKGFSPVMVGQKVMLQWLAEIAPTNTQEGWQTSILRQQLGLAKDKKNKEKQTPETHAHDGIALAASNFMRFEKFHTANARGHHWLGEVTVTSASFRVIARLRVFRRQLHFENPVKDVPGNRKRKGGTVTPFGLRSGDLVKAEKAGKVYIGWIGGYTQTAKTKNVSVYDHNWHRLGQFSPSKVLLIKRSTRLCVAPKFPRNSSRHRIKDYGVGLLAERVEKLSFALSARFRSS